MTQPEATGEFPEFIAEKIGARVNDPLVAEKLIPSDHGFGMRRPPMETFYYEAYNRPNVHLVDLNETPLTTITETGIETSRGDRASPIPRCPTPLARPPAPPPRRAVARAVRLAR